MFTQIQGELKMDFDNYKTNKKSSATQEAFLSAASEGDFATVSTLTSSPLVAINQPNSSGYTALILAARHGHLETVKVLLENQDILVNSPDSLFGASALFWAVQSNHIAVVKVLCEHSKISIDQPNKTGKTAVYLAIELGYEDIAEVIIAHGAVFIGPRGIYPAGETLNNVIHDKAVRFMVTEEESKRRSEDGEAVVVGQVLTKNKNAPTPALPRKRGRG